MLEGSGLREREAIEQAAELEQQHDAHGYRASGALRRVEPPVSLERAWQLACVLDAWERECSTTRSIGPMTNCSSISTHTALRLPKRRST